MSREPRPYPNCHCGLPVLHLRTKFCEAHRIEHERRKNTEYCRAYRAKHGIPKKPSRQAVREETAEIEATLARLDAERRARRIGARL